MCMWGLGLGACFDRKLYFTRDICEEKWIPNDLAPPKKSVPAPWQKQSQPPNRPVRLRKRVCAFTTPSLDIPVLQGSPASVMTWARNWAIPMGSCPWNKQWREDRVAGLNWGIFGMASSKLREWEKMKFAEGEISLCHFWHTTFLPPPPPNTHTHTHNTPFKHRPQSHRVGMHGQISQQAGDRWLSMLHWKATFVAVNTFWGGLVEVGGGG